MRTRLRRYPALGFLAVAALLASLLPSALRVPLSGPSASAELAPVPGKSDSAQGDLSALGETSTGGLGSGGGSGAFGRGGGRGRPGAAPDTGQPPPDDNGSGRNPTEKRCVGKPPRQTEDPLSPPCVAYFKGDNGGATAKGVTAEEIVIVHEQLATSTDCQSQVVYTDYENPDDPKVDQVAAAYVRHFNKRFQTYGRRIHMYGAMPACGMPFDAFHREVDEHLRPFYMRNFDGTDQVALSLARLGIIGTAKWPKRKVSAAHPPFVLSWEPNLDDYLVGAAEFLCARLAGRPARFAGDPTYHGQRRKFGVVYGNFQDEEVEGLDWFLDRVRDRCGEAAGEVVVSTYASGGGDLFTPQEAARLRQEGVTTVAVLNNGAGAVTIHADAIKWYPEWFLADADVIAGDNTITRLGYFIPHAEARSAFGITLRRRLGAPAEQPHVVAFREGCGGCSGALDAYSLETYQDLLLLYWGIQAAGPKLTPANLDKGLHAIPARQSLDPFTPAAYFAPGSWSFVKDLSVVWWDPTGVPPGSNNVGCWRLVEDGLRYRAEDWQKRPGDEGIQQQSPLQPCQGDKY